MSIANLVVQHDRAFIITDSGYFTDDGTIKLLAPKCMEFAEQSVAIACTGSLHLPLLAQELRKHPDCTSWSQPEMVKRLPDLVRDTYASWKLDPVARWSQVVIGLYSHKLGRAMGFFFWTSPDDGPTGQEPWTLYPASGVLLPQDIDARVDPASFDPMRDAMLIVEAQRAKREWGTIKDACCVAGEISLTTISSSGIEHTVLHEYPDKVGEKADAARSETIHSTPLGQG